VENAGEPKLAVRHEIHLVAQQRGDRFAELERFEGPDLLEAEHAFFFVGDDLGEGGELEAGVVQGGEGDDFGGGVGGGGFELGEEGGVFGAEGGEGC